MAKIEVALPAMGEGVIEATITRWLVSEGSMVEEDQPLAEIATDKVDSEIPSPVKGIISKIIKNEGEVPSVGDILVVIETGTETQTADREDVHREVERITGASSAHPDMKEDVNKIAQQMHKMPRQTPSGKFLSPLVRSIAREENISSEELDNIKGSGEGGRINKADLIKYLEAKIPGKKVQADDLFKEPHKEPKEKNHVTGEKTSFDGQEPGGIIPGEGDRVIEMDRMRKLIAGHMIRSKQTSPHVTSFIDADVTSLVKWRESAKINFREREKQNLTYTPLFIEASAKALRDYPMVNISVDGSNIIVRKNINIGIAVALAEGNLIVPVVKNADEKNLNGLVKAVNDLAGRARTNKLLPNEITGGTFTITNFGTFKNTTGTPIINQPEVAILGTGAIIKKPVVMETLQGDVIAIRHIITLSLSYDHRVVDGALGGMFLRRIAEYLENFDPERKL